MARFAAVLDVIHQHGKAAPGQKLHRLRYRRELRRIKASDLQSIVADDRNILRHAQALIGHGPHGADGDDDDDEPKDLISMILKDKGYSNPDEI